MVRSLIAAAALALLLGLAVPAAGAANKQGELYNTYACTLQGITGLTYVVEGASSSTLHGACLAFKRALHQSELRWGLHAPSFSSGETPQATWLSRSLRLKLTLLAVKLPALPALIRADAALLSPTTWRRVPTSYYP